MLFRRTVKPYHNMILQSIKLYCIISTYFGGILKAFREKKNTNINCIREEEAVLKLKLSLQKLSGVLREYRSRTNSCPLHLSASFLVVLLAPVESVNCEHCECYPRSLKNIVQDGPWATFG